MKFLLVSDSHGDCKILSDLVVRYGDKVDEILHCGDSELDPKDTIWSLIHPVKGNCDYGNYRLERVVNTENGKLFYCHGHVYGVKLGLHQLVERAKELGVVVVVYGHTHVMDHQVIDGIHVINPGSIRFPRGHYLTPTYALLDWTSDHIEVTFYQRNGEKVPQEYLPEG